MAPHARRPARVAAALASTLALSCGGPEANLEPVDAAGDALEGVAAEWSQWTTGAVGAAMAPDRSGGVVVTGSFPYATIVTARYDAAGNLLWRRVQDAPDVREQASWVATDAAGNVFVAGYLAVGSNGPGDTAGFVTLKYDPDGNLLWRDVLPVTRGKAIRVETDAAGNAYVTGRAWLAGSGGYSTDDVLTVKYTPGGARAWTRSYGIGAGVETPASMAVAADGAVAIVGAPDSASRFLVVYDADGAVTIELPALGLRPRDVAFGPGGDVYVTGSLYVPGAGDRTALARYGPGGAARFVRTYAGSAGERLAVAEDGGAAIAGVQVQASGLPYTDWLTLRADAAGDLLWSRAHDAHANNDEVPRAIALGGDGAVVVTGQGGPPPSTTLLSLVQAVTVRYGVGGAPEWTATSPASVPGIALRLAPDGAAFVLGRTDLRVTRYVGGGGGAPANVPPVAVASGEPLSGVAPLAVGFRGSGSSDPDGAVAAWAWTFGDGGASSAADPGHVFAEPGVYAVTLRVTDAEGATASTSLQVRVFPAPVVRVADLGLSATARRSRATVTARVVVRDGAGAPVPGAVVTCRWTTPEGTRAGATGTTGAAGVATLSVAGRLGLYVVEVTDVAAPGAWDAAGSVTSASLMVR